MYTVQENPARAARQEEAVCISCLGCDVDVGLNRAGTQYWPFTGIQGAIIQVNSLVYGGSYDCLSSTSEMRHLLFTQGS